MRFVGKLGVGGLQDWGDGRTQLLQKALQSALAALSHHIGMLKVLRPDELLSADAHAAVRESLTAIGSQLEGYKTKALALNETREKHRVRLERRQRRATVYQKERLAKQIAFLAGQSADVLSVDRRTCTLLAAIAAPPAAPATASKMLDLTTDLKDLLVRAFELANVAASKALAVCVTSIFDCANSVVASLFFTCDEGKCWQLQEAVYRSTLDCIKQGMLPICHSADKAYAKAASCDRAGYPLTRSWAKREIEYFSAVTPKVSGYRKMSVKDWPRTAHLQAHAEKVLADPRVQAEREWWMDDFVASQTRERWRDFLLAQRVSVPLPCGRRSSAPPRS